MLYATVDFGTQCGENRHTDIANLATLIHTKKLIKCLAIFTILYGNYYPPRGEFKLICIGKFARRTWVKFTQQYGKNRQSFQENAFYYAVWQLLVYFYREFSSKILSVWHEMEIQSKSILSTILSSITIDLKIELTTENSAVIIVYFYNPPFHVFQFLLLLLFHKQALYRSTFNTV